MGQGIVGHVAESKQPLIVSNVSENRNHLKAIEKAVGFETRNLVAIPIIVRGQVFAVLELLNRQGEDNYSEEDLEVLKYLCETAGKTIEIRMMIAWAARQKLNSSGEAA
jgi:GAF domain-containing protein